MSLSSRLQKLWISSLLLAACLVCGSASAAQPDAQPKTSQQPLTALTVLSADGLQKDVDLLRATLEQLHPGLYRYHSKAEMDAAFAKLRHDFARDQTLQEAFLRLTEFTAQIRCGHTYPSFFNQSSAVTVALFERSDRLPFYFRWIDGRMIVTRDFTPRHRLPAGTEVLSVNGIAAKAMLRRMLPLARSDGGNDAKRINELQVQGVDNYEAADIYLPMLFPHWRAPFQMQIKLSGASAKTQVIENGVSFAQRKQEGAALRSAQTDLPALFRMESLPNGSALLTMPSWAMYQSTWGWKAWLEHALDEVVARQAPALIVDLRGNEGGDDVGAVILRHLGGMEKNSEPAGHDQAPARLVRYRKVPPELLPYLNTWDRSIRDWGERVTELAEPWPTAPPVHYFRRVPQVEEEDPTPKEETQRFRGKVFVLTDASNSSATFGFERTVQQQRLGLLVGEPTGGNQRGINGGSFFFLTLPHSGLEVDVPLIGYFPAKIEIDGGLQPDVPVHLSVDDVTRGVDPVLDTVRRLIANPAH
ncbi:S41 family peptidase [soil metagenome]